MIIITQEEIAEYTKNLFTDSDERITGKHTPFGGEKSFALSMIEQTLGLLNRDTIHDEFVIQYLQGLLALCFEEQHHYEQYLDMFAPNNGIKAKALSAAKLSRQDKRILEETMKSNLGEYTMKGEYQSCCYSAMQAFLIAAYCIISKEITFNVHNIDIIADLDDEVQSINISEAQADNNFVIIQWHSTNKINSIYMLYKTKYSGLDDASILDLVAADVIEEDYYFKDERFSIAPSILVKQYCAIIEHEVNEIIQLNNSPNKPAKHLMWNKMKKYVMDNNIDLECVSFDLKDLLEDLHGLRNDAAHGDIITKEQYEVVVGYKNSGLFDGLSVQKLELQNIRIPPSIEDIGRYMGIDA